MCKRTGILWTEQLGGTVIWRDNSFRCVCKWLYIMSSDECCRFNTCSSISFAANILWDIRPILKEHVLGPI